MHIVCPHCRNPIEIVKLASREEITCPSCGSSFHLESGSTTGWQNIAGQKLGKFELIDVVGQGAFGTVYRARDPELDRTVAIKVPRAGNLVGPQELDRFLREARSAAQLRHPSIVSVHEVGQSDGAPYLVSDFVQGVTLTDLLSARRPSFTESAQLVATVADGLQYAHEQGVVHRDVKPSNVMIRDDGNPCVMDFGLAKRDAGEITMTVEGQVLGTPAYMPPEQARGEGHTVDARGDVYSLGVVLYQLLTGELPFRGTTRMLLHQVLHDEPKAPRSFNDRIPRDLETITLKAMAKEPGRRYGSAKEMAEDLRRWLTGEPIRARRVGRIERALRWARRRPAAAGLLVVSAVAMLALVGLAVGLSYNAELKKAYLSEEVERKQAEAARDEAETAKRGESAHRQKAEEALSQADRLRYVHSIFLADVALKERNVALARQRLEDCKQEMRGWEWHYLNAQRQRELFSIPGRSATFSPDGTKLVVEDKEGVVQLHDARTGAAGIALKATVKLHNPYFSPDGTRLVAVSGPIAHVYDTTTGAEVVSFKPPEPITYAVFSPDGTRIATGDEGRDLVRLYDAQSGTELLALKGRLNVGLAARPRPNVRPGREFSPDGERILLRGSDRRVQVYDVRTGILLLEMKDQDRPFSLPVFEFSPDGTSIGCSDVLSRVVSTYDARTGAKAFSRQTSSSQSIRFSPDGTRLVAEATGGGDRLYDARTGLEVLTPQGPKMHITSFSPDGAWIVGNTPSDGSIHVCDASTGQEVVAFTASVPLRNAQFTPDAARIAAVGNDGLVRVFDARTRAEGFTVHKPNPRSGAGKAHSRDGKRVAVEIYGRIRVYEARTGVEVFALGGEPNRRLQPAFSPDGTKLAVADRGGLRVYDAATGAQTLMIKAEAEGPIVYTVGNPVFSPKGDRIAAVVTRQKERRVRVYDARTGAELLTHKGPGLQTRSARLTFSADGERITVHGEKGTVLVYNASTGELAVPPSASGGEEIKPPFPLWYSPDGQSFARRGDNNTLSVYDFRTGETRFTIRARVGSFQFSPDDARIAAVDGNVVRLYDAQTGQETLALKINQSLPDARTSLTFSPDGERLLLIFEDSLVGVCVYDAPRELSAWQAEQRQAHLAGLLPWHRMQAVESEQAGRWFTAAFHRDWLRKAEPDSGVHPFARGWALAHLNRTVEANKEFESALVLNKDLTPINLTNAHAMLGQWDKAGKVMSQALEALTAQTIEGRMADACYSWYLHALLRLQQEDETGYRQACARMVELLGKSSSYDVTNLTVWTCALRPDALPNLESLLSRIRAAVKANPENWYYRDTLGAILYRAKRYEEAAAELEQARKLNTKDDAPSLFLFLAMTYQRLGKPAEARKHFDEARQLMEKRPRVIWTDRVYLDLLRREAERMIPNK